MKNLRNYYEEEENYCIKCYNDTVVEDKMGELRCENCDALWVNVSLAPPKPHKVKLHKFKTTE